VNLETLQDLSGRTLVEVEGPDLPLFALEDSDFFFQKDGKSFAAISIRQ